MNGRRILRALPALTYAVLIFYGGVIDVGPLPQAPGVPTDKLMHALAFLIFEWLLELALLEFSPRARRFLAVVLSAGAGLLLEGVQAALPHRSAELADFVADLSGALLGAFIASRVGRSRALGAQSGAQ